ncbi:MAG: flagellar biosynthesis anti-sigma factor FlgM [Fibromonadaceae bacterium]|jgi:anti-sigma28 factor (negative regulator of flagellin synthesis)|nr:flagellar biosynthesis anti-sigma factor FlgM [Fibromonadaceae bacterium]
MQVSNAYVQGSVNEWAKKASADSPVRAKKEDAPKKTTFDKVSISADAGKSSSAEALVKARVNALPEVREEKVAVAKERIESGYYNTPEFSKELVGRLAEG